MPEILTYNTPAKAEEKKVKQNSPWYVSKSVYSWFRVQDKFTKTYVIAFLMIAFATPFIAGQYLSYTQKAAAPSVNEGNLFRVSIVNPAKGDLVAPNSTTSIVLNTSDGAKISSVEFLVNGIEKCNLTTGPFVCSWKVPQESGVSYSITVRATDTSGKTAIDMTTVTSGN